MDAVEKEPRPILLQVSNFLAVFLMFAFNILANALPFNGVSTAQVSDSYPNLFTPPGYVFVIWAAIYGYALLFALYQLRPSQKSSRYLRSIKWLYLIGAVINSAWLLVFHYSYGVPLLYLASTGLLLLLLRNLIQIYRKLDIGGVDASSGEKISVHIPISLYLGWISVASIAGVASTINVVLPGIPIAIQVIGTALMLIFALGVTLVMIWRRRDLVYALVVVWAVAGIAVKQVYPVIHFTALAVMGIGLVAALLTPTLRKMSWISYYFS